MSTDNNGIGDSIIVDLQSGAPVDETPPEDAAVVGDKSVNPVEQSDG